MFLNLVFILDCERKREQKTWYSGCTLHQTFFENWKDKFRDFLFMAWMECEYVVQARLMKFIYIWRAWARMRASRRHTALTTDVSISIESESHLPIVHINLYTHIYELWIIMWSLKQYTNIRLNKCLWMENSCSTKPHRKFHHMYYTFPEKI